MEWLGLGQQAGQSPAWLSVDQRLLGLAPSSTCSPSFSAPRMTHPLNCTMAGAGCPTTPHWSHFPDFTSPPASYRAGKDGDSPWWFPHLSPMLARVA